MVKKSDTAMQTTPAAELSAFSSLDSFENAMRMAKLLAASTLVPLEFQGDANLPNCVIALEMAQRLGASPLAVMQSLYVVHGKPGWSAQYIIAALNSSGKFAPLRFKMEGSGDSASCRAWTTDRSGERLEGPEVSIDMAKAEGWYNRKGSKWQTMPELMLRYRAATFFGRLYAPEVMMGMQTVDEIKDVIDVVPTAAGTHEVIAETATASDITERLQKGGQAAQDDPPPPARAAAPDLAEILRTIETAETDGDLDVAEDLINSLKGKNKSVAKVTLLNRRAELNDAAGEE